MENTVKGKIIKGVGGLYTVRVPDPASPLGARNVNCRAKGAFRHSNITPLAGDNVTLLTEGAALEEERKKNKGAEAGALITEIETRKNSLIRPPLANMDYIFVTMAAAHPVPILATVDKMISIAEFNGIEPIIVITKRDLDPKSAERYAEIYRKAGFRVFVISSVTLEGVDEIREFTESELKGSTAAFAGASGIGKSTLMNALFPRLALSTSEISERIERGRHTTRQVELFPLSDDADCGFLADTPGFSMLDFERFDFFSLEELPQTFREFSELIGNCRYTKCSHTKEEGCAILEALKNGDIPPSRHESFLELYATLKAKKKW